MNINLLKVEENDNLKVQHIQLPNNHEQPQINKNLPQHPALLYIPSVRGSGKTNLLVHLLTSKMPYGYCKFFHQIYLFSGSLGQPIWKKLKLDEDNLREEYSNDDFNNIVDKLKSNDDIGKRTLIIIDDMTGQNIYHDKSSLYKFCFNHRHYPFNAGTSIWFVSHQYKGLQKALRNNITDLIIYKINSEIEKKEFWEDNGSGIDKDTFYKLLDMATEQKYNFFYIKKDEPLNTRFRINFDTIINIIDND